MIGFPTPFFGDGRQTRDYIFVGDVVAAMLAAADSTATGAMNVGTGIETDVLDLVHTLAALGGGSFEPSFAPPRKGEIERINDRPLEGAGGAWLARGNRAG